MRLESVAATMNGIWFTITRFYGEDENGTILPLVKRDDLQWRFDRIYDAVSNGCWSGPKSGGP